MGYRNRPLSEMTNKLNFEETEARGLSLAGNQRSDESIKASRYSFGCTIFWNEYNYNLTRSYPMMEVENKSDALQLFRCSPGLVET